MASGDSFWNALALAMLTIEPGAPRSIRWRHTSRMSSIGARTFTARHRVDVGRADVEERPVGLDAGVVDQHVDAAQQADRGRHDPAT